MDHKTCALFLALIGTVSVARASVTVRPLAAHPGDTFTLTVTVDGCTGTAGKLGADSVSISGNDISLSARGTGPGCTMVYSATVASKPVSREQTILVVEQGAPGNVLGTFKFEIVDVPTGPIPPGLTPQVDVMWDVMSESACSDQFGRRVARHYFCIDLQLGNNSGFPIILAGVGFLRHDGETEYRESTASYLSVRSMLQREHVVSGRNITLRTLQAAGVILAGVVPFSGSTGRQGRLNLWSTLVGTVAATAYDGLVPDRTVVQAGNLDDAALRDGKLIPNNAPVRFSVFVDREFPQTPLASHREATDG